MILYNYLTYYHVNLDIFFVIFGVFCYFFTIIYSGKGYRHLDFITPEDSINVL